MNASFEGRRLSRPAVIVLTPLLAMTAMPVWAANAAYSGYLGQVCAAVPSNPNLNAVSCSGGSGDSQSSLNPSQPLASGDQPLARAREKAESAQGEESRPDATSEAVDIGPFSLLVNGRGNWFDRDASSAERGYDGDSYSIELGLDRRLSSRAVVGGFVSYERTNINFDDEGATTFTPPANAGGTQIDSGNLVVFGAYNITPAAYLEAAAGYGFSDYEFRRNAVAQEDGAAPDEFFSVRTRGDSNGHDYWLSLGAGYDANRGAVDYGAFARVTWARSTIDGYREKDLSGTGFALLVDDARRTSLTTTLGVRASRAVSFDWGVLVPAVRVEYEHEFEGDPSSVTSAFVNVPGVTFSPARDDPDQDWFNLALGTQFILPGGLMPYFEAQARLGQRDVDRYQLVLGVRSEF